jgi:hypothetical protein
MTRYTPVAHEWRRCGRARLFGEQRKYASAPLLDGFVQLPRGACGGRAVYKFRAVLYIDRQPD